MPFERGDIVEYSFLIPDTNKYEPHPALIISNQDVYDADECYICVMLTTSERNDIFTYEITDDMLQKPNNVPYAQARLHLVTYVLEKHITMRLPKNRMKANSVDKLVEHIREISLSSL